MSDQEKTTVVLQRNSQPFRLQLIRGQRGGYGWKIETSSARQNKGKIKNEMSKYGGF